jgi:hypothetical protein
METKTLACVVSWLKRKYAPVIMSGARANQHDV